MEEKPKEKYLLAEAIRKMDKDTKAAFERDYKMMLKLCLV